MNITFGADSTGPVECHPSLIMWYGHTALSISGYDFVTSQLTHQALTYPDLEISMWGFFQLSTEGSGALAAPVILPYC